MADLFLSYSRVDRDKAQQIAEALEAEGFSVWWDKILHAGQTYDEVTENMLRDATVCVVLWSKVSVKSKWVRAEATLGERSSVVIPAMLEDAQRPIMFELVQTADLIGWDGDRSEERWQVFVADIQRAIGKTSDEANPAPVSESPPKTVSDPDSTIETTFWTSIKDGSDVADYEAYLKRYPDGHYSDLARNRLAASAAPAAVMNPSPSPRPIQQTTAASAPTPTATPQLSLNPKTLGIAAAALLALVIVGIGSSGGFGGNNKTAGEVDTSIEAVQANQITDCDECPEMAVLAAGTFMMGSPVGETGRAAYEGPRHEVNIPAFAISRTEVTFDQWAACVEDGGCRNYEPGDRGFGKGDQPVLGISWNDAQAYVQWLSRATGRNYRLPSEAEWEFAARGGTDTAYWWGDAPDVSKLPSGQPRAVTSLARNPFGLAGMHGNVSEWVEDCYINSYVASPVDGRAVLNGDCGRRVVRGGAWSSRANQSRAANRARVSVDIRDGKIGLRVATSDISARSD